MIQKMNRGKNDTSNIMETLRGDMDDVEETGDEAGIFTQIGGDDSYLLDPTLEEYVQISMCMEMDKLPLIRKLQIINSLYKMSEEGKNKLSSGVINELKRENISVSMFVEFFDKHISKYTFVNDYDMSIIVLGFNKQLQIATLENGNWVEGSEAYITLFTPQIAERVTLLERASYDKYFAFNSTYKDEVQFKIKDTSNKDVHNTGAKCSQYKKTSIKELLQSVTGENDLVDKIMDETKITIGSLCVIIEFIFRYNSVNKKEGKEWFADVHQTSMIKHVGSRKGVLKI